MSLLVERGSEFEIPLIGQAWTYLGSGGREGLLFLKRRYEPQKVLFSYRAILNGTYLLEFSRQDVLLGETEKRWVSVSVEDASAASPTPQAMVSSPPPPNPSPSPSASASSLAEELLALGSRAALERISSLLDADKADLARAEVSAYASVYPESEEYLWLAAQAAEGPGQGRDVLQAKGLYQRLVSLYPEGSRRPAAEARIEWIQRRILDIR
jgi:hypothetical protein